MVIHGSRASASASLRTRTRLGSLASTPLCFCPQRVAAHGLAATSQRRAYAGRGRGATTLGGTGPPPPGVFGTARHVEGHAADGKRVAIIGGGLTGLTTAFYLSESVSRDTTITIYDASSRLGGWIQTDKVDVDVAGVRGTVSFERGPRSLSGLATSASRYDDLVLYDMCARLGLEPQAAPTDLQRRIYYPDHLVALPPSGLRAVLDAFREPFYRELVPAVLGFLRYHFRGSEPPTASALSITDFVKHVSGSQAAADNAASAVFGGIYGGDIDKIDAETALYPRLQALWLGKASVRNDIANQWAPDVPGLRNPRGKAGIASAADLTVYDHLAAANPHPGALELLRKTHYQQPKPPSLLHLGGAGLQSLTDALVVTLASKPNVDIRTSTPVHHLAYDSTEKLISIPEASGAQKPFDKVIATCGAEALSRMTGRQLPTLGELESVSIMTVNLWFPFKDLKPRGLGYLIPRSVDPALNPEHALGVFFDSDIGNTPADEPEGTKLFVLMGGYHYEKPGVPIPSEADAVRHARSLLERHLGIPADLPCHAVASLKRDCIPQHTVGHRDRMARLAAEALRAYDGRLSLWGGAYTRIGALAALRDGFLAYAGGAGVALDDWAPLGGLAHHADPGYYDVQRGWAARVRPRAFPELEGRPFSASRDD